MKQDVSTSRDRAEAERTHYLVQFGKAGFVGRFHCANATLHQRGARVVIQGPRGLELGVVLCEPAARFQQYDADEGTIHRAATLEDEEVAARRVRQGQAILQAAECSALPLLFVDVEVLLDGTAAILHTLPWDECRADSLFAELSERFDMAIRMHDLSRTPTLKEEVLARKGCDKPGCSSEGGGCSSCSSGGCSSGSCSRGRVKSAEELTTYFAELRQKMEANRTPLV